MFALSAELKAVLFIAGSALYMVMLFRPVEVAPMKTLADVPDSEFCDKGILLTWLNTEFPAVIQMLLHRFVVVHSPLKIPLCVLVHPDLYRRGVDFEAFLDPSGFRMIPIDVNEITAFYQLRGSISLTTKPLSRTVDIIRPYYAMKFSAAIMELDAFPLVPWPQQEWVSWRYPCNAKESPWTHACWNMTREHAWKHVGPRCFRKTVQQCYTGLTDMTIDRASIVYDKLPAFCSWRGLCLMAGDDSGKMAARHPDWEFYVKNCWSVHLSGSRYRIWTTHKFWLDFFRHFGYTVRSTGTKLEDVVVSYNKQLAVSARQASALWVNPDPWEEYSDPVGRFVGMMKARRSRFPKPPRVIPDPLPEFPRRFSGGNH